MQEATYMYLALTSEWLTTCHQSSNEGRGLSGLTNVDTCSPTKSTSLPSTILERMSLSSSDSSNLTSLCCEAMLKIRRSVHLTQKMKCCRSKITKKTLQRIEFARITRTQPNSICIQYYLLSAISSYQSEQFFIQLRCCVIMNNEYGISLYSEIKEEINLITNISKKTPFRVDSFYLLYFINCPLTSYWNCPLTSVCCEAMLRIRPAVCCSVHLTQKMKCWRK